MSSTNGFVHRGRLEFCHKYVNNEVKKRSSTYLSTDEERCMGIIHQAPLSWDEDDESSTSDPLFAKPMPADDYELVLRERGHCIETTPVQEDPWAWAADLDLTGPHNAYRRMFLGAVLAAFLYDKLREKPLSSRTLLNVGWWRPLNAGVRHSLYGPIVERTGEAAFEVKTVMHARDDDAYGSTTWAIVCDGATELTTPLDDTRARRAEVRAAITVALARLAADKFGKYKVFPVVVMSVSNFSVRILQFYIDLSRAAIMLRRTPFMTLTGSSDARVGVLLRWLMGAPVGETRLEPPLEWEELAVSSSEESDEDVPALPRGRSPGEMLSPPSKRANTGPPREEHKW